MTAPLLTGSPRLRRTPFSRRVEAAGVQGYTVYNRMLLPSVFRSLEEDYAHLKSAVQVWDVACERQVEIVGPDARRLVQMTTPRDLSKMADDQCYYIPMVDTRGAMLNDPVLNKLAADRFWVSLADGDMLYYYMGLASGLGLDVRVFEPDVSPLAIQGPRADELVRRVFGQAGVLDTARMASFVAEETGISVRDIHTMVIGGHGDSMVPLTRFSTISGVPATTLLTQEAIEQINEKTRHGGAEVLELRQNSSAYNAPAAAVATSQR